MAFPLSIGLAFFIGMGSSWFWTAVPTLNQRVEFRESGHRFTNPLLECEYQSGETGKDGKLKKTEVESFLHELTQNGYANNIAFYFRDMNNGPWIGIRENETFIPASLLKIPLMMAYFRLAETDPELLQETIFAKNISKLSLYRNNIAPEEMAKEGKTYTVEELIHTMITYSDNISADLLFEHLKPNFFERVMHEVGADFEKTTDGDLAISVRSYASFFRILYNASYLSADSSEKALSLLSKSTFQDGLVAGVPASVPVAHKYGERGFSNSSKKQLHDCGIVYAPGSPYLICVMTQ